VYREGSGHRQCRECVECARAGLCVRVWTHTKDVVLTMHRSCPFECQPINTQTNWCITPSASIETETLHMEVDTAAVMDDESMASGEGGMQNAMAAGDAGQHTIQENGKSSIVRATLLSGCNTLNFDSRRTAGGRSYKHARREQQIATQRPSKSLYEAPGRGRSISGNCTSTADKVDTVTPESLTLSLRRSISGNCTSTADKVDTVTPESLTLSLCRKGVGQAWT